MAKLPAFQFYPGDWMKDPCVRRCSHAAKGVWVDMLCLMFECERRGVLATGSSPWSLEEVVAAVGGNADVTRCCIDELVTKRVCAIDETGAYYSKRMVRDEETRQHGKDRQTRHRKKPLSRVSNGGCNAVVTPMSHDSSSSSSTSVPPNPQGVLGEVLVPDKLKAVPRFMEALNRYAAMLGKHGKVNTISLDETVRQLSDYPERRATAYLLYWTSCNRYMPKWDAGYEPYMPKDDTPPTPAAEPRTYQPRIKIPGGAA